MTDEGRPHRERVPEPLEVMVTRLGELRVLFGDAGVAVLKAVEDDVRRALAARDHGQQQESVAHVGRCMERLAGLAGTLDSEGSEAMRALITQFRVALARGREGDARRAAEIMRAMSGARPVDDG